jgi:undecaprenyl-phosphate 4-deoxy-4-formamido-L-arabinose transferase
MKWLLRHAIPELPPYYSAYRVINRNVAHHLPEMQNSYTFLDGYLTWITRSVCCCDVEHHERTGGVSGYSLRKLIEQSVNILVTFSTLPLRLVTVSAIVTFACVLLYATYVVVRTLVYHNLAKGFPTIIIVSSGGCALILLAIGIVGEYIFRINQKTTRRPNFVVAEEL